MINVPTSIGEVVDKITILQIKAKKITDKTKLENVQKELNLLTSLIDDINIPRDLISILKDTNELLWDIEDRVRLCEKKSSFDQEFVDLARAVYITNDQRAAIKREINAVTGSELVEEKHYV